MSIQAAVRASDRQPLPVSASVRGTGARTMAWRPVGRPRPSGSGRVPVTLGVVALLLCAAIATATLWRAADPESGLLQALSFGTPRLQDGRIWTFATGAFLLPRPEFYPVVGLLLVIGLGGYERRVGSVKALIALVGTQLFGTVSAAIVLLPFDGGVWPWAAALADKVDLGLSAGALGVVGAASALTSDQLRVRLRAFGIAYLTVAVVRSGLLWDLEHLLAFSAGLIAGPRLAGRRCRRMPLRHFDSLHVRGAVAILISSIATANLVDRLYPGLGGLFGNGTPTHPPMRGIGIAVGQLVVALLVADALRRGRAAAWWVASAGSGLTLVNSVIGLLAPAAVDPTAHSGGGSPLADPLSAGLVLAVLLVNRRSWRWRTRTASPVVASDGSAARCSCSDSAGRCSSGHYGTVSVPLLTCWTSSGRCWPG